MKYAYYPGCIADASEKEANLSTLKIARRLNIELQEMPTASCCGAGDIARTHRDFNRVLNARILALAEKEELEIATICNLCLLNLKTINMELQNSEKALSEVNKVLERINLHYKGKVRVKHFLWIIIKDIGLATLRKHVNVQLNGLKVAPFYGCQILRPSEVLEFDDPQDPQSLENIIHALGGESIKYEDRTKCCGFSIYLVKRKVTLKILSERLLGARENGAECIITPCPLCHLALDMLQKDAEKLVAKTINLPVFYFSQLIGLAMGIKPHDLHMHRHFVKPDKIVSRFT